MRISTSVFLITLAACSTSQPPIQEPAQTNGNGHEQWRLLHWRDENGRLPSSADWVAARGHARDNADHWDTLDVLERTDWIERGPNNVGGRTRALVIHPDQPWRMWAGSVGGGVWRSDTYGNNWEPLDEFMGNLAISCLTLDPSDPDVIYAGTGESFGNIDAIRGEGIWKSVNGGDTWGLMSGTEFPTFGNVNRIAVSPADSGIILVATSTGVQRTTDGGGMWTQVVAGDCQQVLFDPNSATRCIAPIATSGGNRQIRVSTNAGASWSPAANGTFAGRVELSYAPNTPNLVYASGAAGGSPLSRSTNGGVNWSALNATGLNASQTWYNNSIWVDPTNSNRLVIGYVEIYGSTDGGASFTMIGAPGTQGYDQDIVHVDVHYLTADPRYDGSTNKALYACTDGGVFRTADITTATPTSGWSERENSYNTFQIYGIAGHGSGRLLAGAQDNGTALVEFGNLRGTRIGGGDGGPCAIVPEDPDTLIFTTQNLGIWRGNAKAVGSEVWIRGFTDTGLFISPLEIDPGVTDRVFAGGTRLWRTDNVRATTPSWTPVSVAQSGSPTPLISAIAIAPSDSRIVWIGFDSGVVLRTTDVTASPVTWVPVDNGGTVNPLPNRIITHIEISHANPVHAAVALGGFSAGNVQLTTNNGAAFAPMTGSGPMTTRLPNAPVRAIAQHPVLADRWYAATEVGVFETRDNGVNWSTQHAGPADVSCDDIDFIPGTTTLMLGTHGRGMWTAEAPAPGAVRFGTGCAGALGTPAMNIPAPPRIGQAMTIESINWSPGTALWLVHGSSRHQWFGATLPFDLAPLNAPGCKLLVRPDIVREFQASNQANGAFTTQMPIANNPALIGTQFYLQMFGVDGAANGWGRTASDAFHLTIGS
ncbi:MAG: hypothetical protein NXI31_01560 [bacterium]|nr:hypothetical protein [bacterium]